MAYKCISSLISTGEEIKLKSAANEYLEHLADHCICRISCMVGVKETKQTHTDLDEVRLRKPHLTIKVHNFIIIHKNFRKCFPLRAGSSDD